LASGWIIIQEFQQAVHFFDDMTLLAGGCNAVTPQSARGFANGGTRTVLNVK
jgi:hypothetical protein